MTHRDLVDHGERWLRSRSHRVIFKEHVSTHENPDVIGWMSGGQSTLIECKTSRPDFLADQRKRPRQSTRMELGEHRYYLAPKGILQLSEIPEGWGLLEIYGKKRVCIRVSRESPFHRLSVHQVRNELRMLVSELTLYQEIPMGKIIPQDSRRVKAILEHLRKFREDV